MRPVDNIVLFRTGLFSLDTNMAFEGGFNLPPVFQEAPFQPDLWHLADFFRLEGRLLNRPEISALINGSVSATWRDEEGNVEGLGPVGIDYNIRGGLSVKGKKGGALFYIGNERLTDSWTGFEQQPVNIKYMAVELTSGID